MSAGAPGSIRPRSGSPKARAADAAAAARRRERPAGLGALAVVAEPEERRLRFGEHVRADAVGPQGDPLPEPGQRGPPDRVVHVRSRVVGVRGAGVTDEARLLLPEVDAVGQEGTIVQGARPTQAPG